MCLSVSCVPPLQHPTAVVLFLHGATFFCFAPPHSCPALVILRHSKLPSKLDRMPFCAHSFHLTMSSVSCRPSCWQCFSCGMSDDQSANVRYLFSFSSCTSSSCALICDATTAVIVCNCSTCSPTSFFTKHYFLQQNLLDTPTQDSNTRER